MKKYLKILAPSPNDTHFVTPVPAPEIIIYLHKSNMSCVSSKATLSVILPVVISLFFKEKPPYNPLMLYVEPRRQLLWLQEPMHLGLENRLCMTMNSAKKLAHRMSGVESIDGKSPLEKTGDFGPDGASPSHCYANPKNAKAR